RLTLIAAHREVGRKQWSVSAILQPIRGVIKNSYAAILANGYGRKGGRHLWRAYEYRIAYSGPIAFNCHSDKPEPVAIGFLVIIAKHDIDCAVTWVNC